MGLEAISTKPQLSQAAEGHARYPYLVRGVQIARVNQVWNTAMTSIRLPQGLISLGAVIDGFSRHVRSWALAITLDGALCLEARAHVLGGGCPAIVKTDEGALCTRRACTERRRQGGIPPSMDGWGRALAHVFVERRWRTIKYEEVYLREYTAVRETKQG